MQGARGRMRRLAHRKPLRVTQSCRYKPTYRLQQAGASVPGLCLTAFDPAPAAVTADLLLLRHELRTPLTGMLGLAELLSAQDLPGNAPLWLATLQACGQQMANLIDRLLGPGEPAGERPEHQAVDGLRLMESLVAAHWPAARAGRTGLLLAFHQEALGLWQTDTVALRQAVDNLLANAIRFSRKGCVLLEVRVVAALRAGFNLLELEVEDSGTDPETSASNLQDEGEFADRTYRMSSRGRGLRVVEQACQSFAGKLQRSSSHAGGARFTLTLAAGVPGRQQPLQPFRPALLKKLHCFMKLEPFQQRAVAAMLGCLDIGCEAVDGELALVLHGLSPFRILICSQSQLPQSLLQGSTGTSARSIWLLARVAGTRGPELFQQPLPEPLLQADLQNALLHCLVVQGMAACQPDR